MRESLTTSVSRAFSEADFILEYIYFGMWKAQGVYGVMRSSEQRLSRGRR